MLIRRVMIAVLSAAALALSVLGGAAPASAAASPASVTIQYVGGNYQLSTDVIDAQVGDTFTVINEIFGQTAYLRNGSGAFEVAGDPCVGNTCQITDGNTSPSNRITVTVVSTGTLTVAFSVSATTFTLTVGGASGPTDPALVYPTANINANGGTCTGTLQFTKYNNQNSTITTSTGATCTRAQYRLAGWARSADSRSTVWAPGESVPIGNESFTMYAVWSPIGVEITYDSNIGDAGQCLNSSDVNVVPGPGRVSSTVTTTTLASAAPCRPQDKDLVLSGWATSGSGSVVYQLGESLTSARIAEGSVLRLFAVWQPTLSVICTQPRGVPLWTFSCTDFGDVPVGWEAVISVVVTNQRENARALKLVAQPLNTSGVNGTLVAKPKEGDCDAALAVPPKGSCTLHYSWTPERAGSLSSGTSITVCQNGNINSCYRTALNSGLRGNAYVPVVNAYGISISVLSELKPDSSATATITATLNGAPATNARIAVTTSGSVSFAGGGKSETVTTNSQGQGTVTLIGSTSPGTGILSASFGDKSASASIDVVSKSINITGSRSDSIISIEGFTTGFADGSTVVPYIRFPGQPSFTEVTSRPVNTAGEFTWQRKTGKRIAVYFISGDVRSNTVVIGAK